MHRRDWLGLAFLTLIVCLVPVAVTNQYYLSVLIFLGIYVIVTVGLTLLMGFAGQISLGHAGFFGIGGYTSAILTKMHGWPPLMALGAGMVLAGLAALLVGMPALRLRGHYLAMATLGFGEIIFITANAAVGLTDGPSGFSGVPSFSIMGLVCKSGTAKYILVWGIALAVIALSLNLIRSRIGRALKSIHGDETASAAMGVNVPVLKVQVFVFSAMLAALAGSLYVHHMRFVSPTGFSTNRSILFLIMIMSGGMQSVWGAVAGAALFTLLPEMLRVFSKYDILVYGVVLLGMMMFLPTGIAGLVSRLKERLETRWKR